MDIEELLSVLVGQTIEDATCVYGEDTLTLYLSSGASVELIIDSSYVDVPDYDD